MTACASAASRSCAMGTGQAEARKQKADGTGCRARGTLEPIPIQKKNISIFSWKKKLESAISDSGVFENNAHLSGGRNCCFPFSLRSSPRSPRTQCWAMKTRCRPFEINAYFCSRRNSGVPRAACAIQHCIRGEKGGDGAVWRKTNERYFRKRRTEDFPRSD